jgi:uncharacterized coiled-coil protein SlyX
MFKKNRFWLEGMTKEELIEYIEELEDYYNEQIQYIKEIDLALTYIERELSEESRNLNLLKDTSDDLRYKLDFVKNSLI